MWGSAVAPKPRGGAGSADKRKETTEGGGSAKKQQKVDEGGAGVVRVTGKEQKMETTKLSEEELLERKKNVNLAKEARAYFMKCKAFAHETKHGEGGEEGDGGGDGMMEGLNHCALGAKIREWHKNIPAPKSKGDRFVAMSERDCRNVLKDLCVYLFEMAILAELPGTGWEQYICNMEEIGLFSTAECDTYNAMAMEEKYPGGYSPQCGGDDDDDFDDEFDDEDD
ncbi:hypothetical protein T484DRAFT_1853916 [Baffinella frigidus]|nr:hypothetical protein T484DRAFT_1853916 [Cryptophyta sp. CCMP2293]